MLEYIICPKFKTVFLRNMCETALKHRSAAVLKQFVLVPYQDVPAKQGVGSQAHPKNTV